MKISWLAGSAMLGLSTVATAQSVTLSGVIDLSARYTRNSAGSMKSLSSGNNSTSRIVVRGVEDLGDGLKAGFWLESTLQSDTGLGGATTTTPSNQFWDRVSILSLSGPLGELRLGRDYTPAFRSFAGSDPFGYVGIAGLGNMFSAGPSTAIGRAFGTATTTVARSNNALQYLTPGGLGGFYANAMIAPGEAGSTQGAYKYLGARVGYAVGKHDVSLYAAQTTIAASGSELSQIGAAGKYDFGIAELRASITQSKYLTSKHTALVLSTVVPLGRSELKASYVRVNQQGTSAAGASIDANDADAFGLGYVYNLSKRTAVYATAAHISNQGEARYVVPGGPAGAIGGSSSTGYEAGLRHNF